jgi:inhibitor of KinA sporulation pathway (predicted exonuclease)
MRTDKVLVVDLEATCWETREESARNTSEIIEIGVAVYNRRTKQVEKSEGILVKPRDSVISPFCTSLTTLTQEQVDQGLPFDKAMARLFKQYDSKNYPWISYGDYDKNMIERQCKRWGIKNPMSDDHTNIKVAMANKLGVKPRGMDGMLQLLGIPLEGTHHRGVDDANNIAKIFAAYEP